MHIGIDARMLGSLQGGLGRYIEQLFKHLLNVDNENHYTIFLRKENFDLVEESHRVKKVLADIPWYGWKEQTKLLHIFDEHPVDLMHFPHWNISIGYKKPFVVTIHDLLLLHHPSKKASTKGLMTYWAKQAVYKAVVRHAARASKHILTVSQYSKNDIIETLKVPESKITVTYNGVSFLNKEEKDAVLEKYGITRPFALYVGVAYPHKNLPKLVDAWRLFIQKYGRDYQLVLVGKYNYFYQELKKYIDEFPELKDQIILTDFVPDDELPTLYKKARTYVTVSKYEGACIPALEAITFDTPIVSSSATALPEILGEGALYVNPDQEEEIADGLYRVFTDENVQDQLILQGSEEIKRFSWDDTARATLHVYKKCSNTSLM